MKAVGLASAGARQLCHNARVRLVLALSKELGGSTFAVWSQFWFWPGSGSGAGPVVVVRD